MDEEGEPSSIRIAIESSRFTEYVRFEGSQKRREHEKRGFMAGIYNAPDYDYPYLQALDVPDEDGVTLEDRKGQARAVLAALGKQQSLEAAGEVKSELYSSFFETQLKKIMLVEVASRMRHFSSDSEVQQLAVKEDFMELNRDLYGDMDDRLFSAVLSEEQRRAKEFMPGNKQATMIKRSLMSYFLMHRFKGANVKTNERLLSDIHRLVHQRYQHVLAVIPDSKNDVIYDAYSCREILQAALEAGGLAKKGWQIRIDDAKSNPSTNAWDKTIVLPSDTMRTAAQLRRLMLHEQEVHARRAQNGEEAGLAILRSGTAGYAAAEEGLGVLMECAVDGTFENESYHRVRDRYIAAGLALGLDGKPKDGRATFSLLWRLMALRLADDDGVITEDAVQTAKRMAMSATENAFRGTNFLMPGIIYMKLKVYYEGLRDNIAYFSRYASSLEVALDIALTGKYNHTDSEERATVQSMLS